MDTTAKKSTRGAKLKEVAKGDTNKTDAPVVDASSYSIGDHVSVSFRGEIVKLSPDGIADVKIDGDELLVHNVRIRDATLASKKLKDSSGKSIHGHNKKINTAEMLQEGTKVECNYHGKGTWYPARVSKVRKEGTYDVIYDDGDQEQKIPADRVKAVTIKSAATVAKSSSVGEVRKYIHSFLYRHYVVLI
jgi:hypothetical protein